MRTGVFSISPSRCAFSLLSSSRRSSSRALLAAAPAQAQRPSGAARGAQQATGALTGLVTDGATGSPLPGATVALYRDADLISGALTDADGAYVLEGLRPGAYRLRVSYVGYVSQDAEAVLARGQRLALAGITLETDQQLLEGVEVLGERAVVEQRIDRTVYTTEDQAVTTGGNALDVLQTVPSLEVDQDGALSLRGSQNVVVQINGRPVPVRGDQLSGLLRQLPAEQVARVEVIPNPSAKYEPDGMSGIVNIVLKDNARRGLGGGLSLSATDAIGGEANASVSYGTAQTDLYVGYGIRYDQDDRGGFSFRDDYAASGALDERQDQIDTSGERERSHSLNLQADYRPSARTTLSATGFLSIGDEEGDGSEDNDITIVNREPGERDRPDFVQPLRRNRGRPLRRPRARAHAPLRPGRQPRAPPAGRRAPAAPSTPTTRPKRSTRSTPPPSTASTT